MYRIAQEDNALFDHYGISHDQTTLSDYLDYESEYDIPLSVLDSIIRNNKLQSTRHKFAVSIIENGTTYWFILDKKLNTFDYQKDIDDWLASLEENDMCSYLGITDGDVYAGNTGFLNDIRTNPGIVYHYTNEEDGRAFKETDIFAQVAARE